jgi:tetratricopeptide (TPR) repeat protein
MRAKGVALVGLFLATCMPPPLQADVPRGAPASHEPVTVAGYLRRAQQLAKIRAWGPALKDVEWALAIAPDEPAALRLKGALLVRSGRPRDAIAVFQRVAMLQPYVARAYYDLGHAIQASEDMSRSPEAISAYDHALRLDRRLVDAYALRGEVLTASGDLQAVTENYEAWIKLRPRDARAFSSYAEALRDLGETARALTAVNRSLAIKPTAQGYVVRARLRPESEVNEALSDVTRAIELEPNVSSYLTTRAQILARSGRFDDALKDLEQAITYWPSSVAAFRLRSDIYLRTKKYDLAVNDVGRLLELQPGSANLLNLRCWTRAVGSFQLDLALVDCKNALTADPQNADILDTQGFLFLRLGDPARAIESYNAALTLRSGLAESLFGRGVARLRLGEKAAGDADIAAARRISTTVEGDFIRFGLAP